MIHRDSTGGDGDEVCSCRSAIALFLVANFKVWDIIQVLQCTCKYTQETHQDSGDVIANSFTTTSSTTFTQCAPEATEFGEITQNKGHYAVQGHSRSFKVTDFGTNRKLIRLPISD